MLPRPESITPGFWVQPPVGCHLCLHAMSASCLVTLSMYPTQGTWARKEIKEFCNWPLALALGRKCYAAYPITMPG
jgi:hypothetical protein